MLKYFILASLTLFAKEPDIVEVSEAMGHIIGKNLESLGLDFNLDAIVKGLKEESAGLSSPLNEDECVEAIHTLQDEKIAATTEQDLIQADAIANGDQIVDNQ
jgi:peptidylprolyl isomerase